MRETTIWPVALSRFGIGLARSRVLPFALVAILALSFHVEGACHLSASGRAGSLGGRALGFLPTFSSSFTRS